MKDFPEMEPQRAANARLIAAAPDYHKHAYTLAMLGLQSDRYQTDPDFRDAVDSVLHTYWRVEGR